VSTSKVLSEADQVSGVNDKWDKTLKRERDKG
jgi:hypothetical protein